MKHLTFSVRDTVESRISVRTYEKDLLPQNMRQSLLSYAEGLENPIGPKIRLQFIEKTANGGGEKLGTYGMIKDANLFLGVTVPKEEYALESLGYEFERVVLYARSLGLGTCWLGGTFNRSAFTAKMDIRENEIFPILCPVGYPAAKPRASERLFRRTVKARRRLPWEKTFFLHDFDHPLSEDWDGTYAFPLEMVRLAPSAVNKQPWRIVVTDNAVHFFEKHTLGGEAVGVDIQRIDLGIALCHFHLAAMEQNLPGHFERTPPDMAVPPGMTYIVSWKEGGTTHGSQEDRFQL